MKKKLIIGVLALSMCFAMSSCDVINGFLGGNSSSSSSTTETEYDVASAAEVLYDSLVDKDEETRVDYTVPNTLSYLKNVYTITWSVNVTEGVSLTKGDTETTVVVDKNAQADIEYVLTAVVSDPDGKTETIEFERKVLQAPTYTPEAITAKPVENQAYKLYVYQSTSKIDCYFTGLMSGYYFKTSEDYTEGVDVYVEYVEGSTDLFNLYFNHTTDGKQYIGVEISGTHSNIVYKSAPVSSFSYSTELGTIITNVEGADYYLGNYSNYNTIQASKTSYASSSNVGGLVEMIDKNNIAPEKKVAKVKESLSVQTEHKMNKEIELSTYDERFADVTIAWALSETTCATLSDGNLTLTIPAEETSVTLTATITCGEKSDTKEFTLKLGPSIVLGSNPTEAEIVNAAFSLATNEALDGEFTLTGKITKIKTAYDESYGNITVIISTNEKEIECFRLKGEGAADLKVGDTIQVNGTIKNYNGTVEFDSGCALLSVSEDQGEDEAPTTLATFEFGDNVDTTEHKESTTALTGEKSYTSGDYTLTLTDMAKVYDESNDAKGNSALKIGTGKATGSFKFAIPDDVNAVVIKVAGYKAAASTKIKINGTEYTVTTASNNGEYTSITIDTTTTKTVEFVTVTYRAMIDSIVFMSKYEAPVETPVETPTFTPITAAPVANVAYTFYAVNGTETQYFAGYSNGYYFTCTTDATKAVTVYAEPVESSEGSFYLYYLDSTNTKHYLVTYANSTYVNNKTASTVTDATAYYFNTEHNAIMVDLLDTSYFFCFHNNAWKNSKIDYITSSSIAYLQANA